MVMFNGKILWRLKPSGTLSCLDWLIVAKHSEGLASYTANSETANFTTMSVNIHNSKCRDIPEYLNFISTATITSNLTKNFVYVIYPARDSSDLWILRRWNKITMFERRAYCQISWGFCGQLWSGWCRLKDLRGVDAFCIIIRDQSCVIKQPNYMVVSMTCAINLGTKIHIRISYCK